MQNVPETRASLILRLPSAADAEAWREFAAIYEPFVYRFARRGGLQDADAHELVQNVMLAVARAVGRWRPDENRGRFRTWLFRISRNQLIDLSSRLRRQALVRGGTDMLTILDQQPSTEDWSNDAMTLSHRQELFRWAAERVEQSVQPATWQAFWMTAMEDQAVEKVADRLGLSVGAIYVARSRVTARLREEVKKWEDDDALS